MAPYGGTRFPVMALLAITTVFSYPYRIAILEHDMEGAFGVNGLFEHFRDLLTYFWTMDDQHHFGIELNGAWVKIERADHHLAPVDHVYLGM